MPFDFESYLARVHPQQKYDIQHFTVGIVNFAARASTIKPTVRDEDWQNSYFPGHSTFVLKQSPPYLAAIGESAAFSQERQVGLPMHHYSTSNDASFVCPKPYLYS